MNLWSSQKKLAEEPEFGFLDSQWHSKHWQQFNIALGRVWPAGIACPALFCPAPAPGIWRISAVACICIGLSSFSYSEPSSFKNFSYPHREVSPCELRVLLAQAVFFLTFLSLGGLSEISLETWPRLLSACFTFPRVSEPGFPPQTVPFHWVSLPRFMIQ